MINIFYIWIFLTVLFFIVLGNGNKGGALSMAYFFGLSMIHVPGLYVNTSLSNDLPHNLETELGFLYTLLGLTFLILGIWISKIFSSAYRINKLNNYDYLKLSKYLIILGVSIFLFFLPIVSFIPSLSSITSPLTGLLMIGFWFLFYHAKETKQNKLYLVGILFLPLLPIVTMVNSGFVGFGAYWVLTILSFLYILLDKKFVYLALIPIIVVLGLSFSVSYFNNRETLRENVWYKQASFNDRLDVLFSMVEDFELLDKNDINHAKVVDDRLNQNALLGLAIIEREAGRTEPALGSTVPLWIFIPRILWSDKPNIGGSNSIVSDYTGLEFASHTSVGVGQPMEFYINFGISGIIIGFLILGFVLNRIDYKLTHHFKSGNLKGVLINGLVGISLLQPGGSLMEILISVIGSFILSPLIAGQLHLYSRIQVVVLKKIRYRSQSFICTNE